MRSTLTTLAALVFLGTSSLATAQDEPAAVAKLNKTEGTVLVDQGKGFRSSKANTPLYEGNRVITLDKSTAEVIFNDGCKTQLNANNMITVALKPGCKAAIVAVNGAMTAGAAGPLVPLSSLVAPVLVGAAAFLVLQGDGGDDDTPISAQ